MNKYYTPEIQEFHVGFRCYHRGNLNAQWELLISDSLFIDQFVDFNDKEVSFGKFIKVKYLDLIILVLKQTLEGYVEKTLKNNEVFHFEMGFESQDMSIPWHEILYYPHDNSLTITEQNWDNDMTLFCGKVRNYNELKKVMKQIGI